MLLWLALSYDVILMFFFVGFMGALTLVLYFVIFQSNSINHVANNNYGKPLMEFLQSTKKSVEGIMN